MLRAVLIGAGLGVVIDLTAAYLWLCFGNWPDGPQFPY